MRDSGKIGNILIALLMVASLTIAGCGGGGGSAVEEEVPPMPTPEQMACDAGPSAACVAYHEQNVAALLADPDATQGEVQAAQEALASAQNALAMKQEADAAAALEAEIAACGAAGGRWEEAGTCTSAEDLAAEQEAADFAEALKEYQDRVTAALEAAQEDLAEARAALAAVENADPDNPNYKAAVAAVADAMRRVGNIQRYQTQVDEAETIPEAAENAALAELRARQAAARLRDTLAAIEKFEADVAKEQYDVGKALYAALGANPLGHLGDTDADTIAGNNLTLEDSVGTAFPAMKAGDSVGSMHGWDGTGYSQSSGEGAAQVNNDAVVYTNQGPSEFIPFGHPTRGYTVATTDTTDDIKGYVTLAETDADELARINVSIFEHSGTQNHDIPDRSDALYVRGKYDGADGEYRCTGACSSTNDGKDTSPSALGGVWHFKPDAGAMIEKPDTNYLYFGWWVSKSGGDPEEASAFRGVEGTIAPPTSGTDSPEDLQGTASYAGLAVGKFAITNTLEGTGNGGHFTADVELNAKFGAITTPNNGGISGTIDNFRLNDGANDPNWSVSLHHAPWGSAGAFATPNTDDTNTANVNETLGTTWSINGNAAPRSGTWSGQMYDEKTAALNDDDGSDLPTTAIGTFQSTFTESGIGRMVGAFGANKQD